MKYKTTNNTDNKEKAFINNYCCNTYMLRYTHTKHEWMHSLTFSVLFPDVDNYSVNVSTIVIKS